MSRVHGIHHRSRRYVRTAGNSVGASHEGASGDKPSKDEHGQASVAGKQDSQLITEVGEDGRVVQVVEEESPLQVIQALPQDVEPNLHQPSDMQVIYVELAE